jgi:hypothetical protein
MIQEKFTFLQPLTAAGIDIGRRFQVIFVDLSAV